MLSINTNLSNLLMQKSLKNATNLLNQAVERMTTGFKINGAKDNAANHAIVQQMNTQLSSLDVAEDNTATGLDLVTTANDNLDLINERFERLRNLAMQVENETYGVDSKSAINVECEALVEEIKNLYKQAEFNGMKIYGAEFFETVPTTPTEPIQTFANTPIYADVNTTLQELGIDYSSFEIYNSNGGLIESYDTEKSDTLQDIFDVLSNYGFNSTITDGVISITSSSGRYVTGDLMEKFGINLDETQFIESSKQNSDSAVYYTTTVTASESSTFADMGVLTSGTDTVTIKDKFGDVLTSFNVNSSTTLGGLFNQLGNYDIQGEVDDGVITLSSSKGNYVVSNGVISNLGIGLNQSTSAVTTGTTQSSAGVVTYESITMSGGEVTTTQQEVITTIWTTTTTSQTVTNTIWTTTTTSTTNTETVTETIQVETTTVVTTETVTTVYTAQSEQLMVEEMNTIVLTPVEVSVVESMRVSKVSSFNRGQTYYISTTSDLQALGTLLDSGVTSNGVYFELANDLDLSSISNWTPINGFLGNFNGNGYIISHLTINDPDSEIYDKGLFGTLSDGVVISNLGLEDVSINATNSLGPSGGLAGYAFGSTITNCYVSGTISGDQYVGGLLGYGESLSIANCGTYGTVSGNSQVGGLIGDIWSQASSRISTINICHSSMDVSGDECIGGLVGGTSNSDEINECINIINCYATGTVTGMNYLGGLIGAADKALINYCYATGDVVGDITADSRYIGGLIGDSGSSVMNSFSTGNVIGYGSIGGFIGNCLEGDAINCYTTGNVIGSNEGYGIGGFVGNHWDASMRNCYATGTVTGNGACGFNGSDDIYINNCYCVQAVGNGVGTQKTLAEIQALYSTMGFTTTNGWTIVDGMPKITSLLPVLTTVTTSTTLGELGFTNGASLTLPDSSLDLGKDSTLQDLIDSALLNNKVTNAELVDGVLLITTANTALELSSGFMASVSATQTSECNTATNSTTQTILVDKEQDKTIYNTIYTTTTSSTTNTSTVWNTTTSSATNTETIDITTTTPIIYTTANISITSDTTFSELGLSSRSYITVMKDDTKTIITLKTADTVQDLVTKLNSSGITTSLNNGQLTLSPNSKSKYISGMSDSLIDIFKLESDFYTSSLGLEMTDSNLLVNDNAIITINQSTSLSDIGVTSGELVVKQDGNDDKTIAISESQSVADFVADLQNAGFNASCVDGAIKLSSNGDRYLASSSTNSSNAVSVFGLNNVEQEIGTSYANTNSDELNKVDEIVNVIWKASSPIRLQIGTGSDEHSRIEIETGFTILDLDKFARIGKNMVNKIDFISELDVVLNTISEKQVELGAYSNRLESVLEEISIKYDNLVSSRSTLRDADIAEESAIYIQQQILQQAAATLMATTANQTPQLALQLI